MGVERLRYHAYRCDKCQKVLTRNQIVRKWEKAERGKVRTALSICECGSMRVRPTNLTLFEELTNPWVLWIFFTEILPAKLGLRKPVRFNQ